MKYLLLLLPILCFANIVPDKDKEGNLINNSRAFTSPAIQEGVLYKRVHGVSASIPANTTANIDYVVGYTKVKFTGAEIFGAELGDYLDFTVHDTATNAISGLDVGTYGANIELNKFGNKVYLTSPYKNTSQYDATLYQDMIVRARFTNSSNSAKTIYINMELHEVKDQ